MGQYKYKAFISYSHRDEKWCGWLHRRLENYKIPKPLIGRETALGPIPANLKPVFRDKDELSAGSDLGEHIQAALDGSEFLIVLCSPNSARSHWVNEEIIYFKHHHPDRQVFSIIVDGIPFDSDGRDTGQQECFPPALRFQVDPSGRLSDRPAEPLAADVSERGDGKRLGSLRLISGMIGVGLDDLVQRDMKKERRRVTIITSTALVTVLIMSGLTWAAMSARGAAERAQAEAEMRRAEAEGLTEFMLTDLKDKLVPLGKLDVMDGVADKVIEYYENYPEGVIDCAASSRHAQSLHLAAEISNSSGDQEAFAENAQNAYNITERNLAECEDQERALFDHGQSAFWRGYVAYNAKDEEERRNSYGYFEQYVSVSEQLVKADAANKDFKLELAHAKANIGIQKYRTGLTGDAIEDFWFANAIYRDLCKFEDSSNTVCYDLANIVAWESSALRKAGEYENAILLREEQIQLLNKLVQMDYVDPWAIKYSRASAQRQLAQLHFSVAAYDEAQQLINTSRVEFAALTRYDPENATWKVGLKWVEVLQFILAQELGKDHLKTQSRKAVEDILMTLSVENRSVESEVERLSKQIRRRN